MVCSANGHFFKQASGHYEYEGGDTRLVGISSASSLLSLKESLSRVVTKAGAGSTSASGSPEVILLVSVSQERQCYFGLGFMNSVELALSLPAGL